VAWVLRTKDPAGFGYQKVEHAGFRWLTTENGARFLLEIDDWSPDQLALRKEWNCRTKPHHAVYLGRDQEGNSYLIKDYAAERNQRYLFGAEANRAKNEFSKTLFAHKKSIPTVLPLAVGEWRADTQRGVIIYPFLDRAIPFERVYETECSSTLATRERQCVERKVGELLRNMVEAGAYPVDGHLDHFLALRAETGEFRVYYVDFERIEFSTFTKKWFLRSKLIKTLGRLTARLEWYRVSGGRINRAAMMRISHAFFRKERWRPLDKGLRRVVIEAAKRYWYRREFHKRGPYGLRSFQ
jgi:hypothetical protein